MQLLEMPQRKINVQGVPGSHFTRTPSRKCPADGLHAALTA